MISCKTIRCLFALVSLAISFLASPPAFSASLNPITGEHTQTFLLFSMPNSFMNNEFSMVYHSLDYYKGPSGNKWRHPLTIYLQDRLKYGDFFFERLTSDNGSDNFVFPFKGDHFESWRKDASLTPIDGGGFKVKVGASEYLFDDKLLLTRIIDPIEDIDLTFEHVGEFVTAARDREGNTIRFSYAGGRLDCITSPAGEKFHLVYNELGNLTTIIFPNNSSYRFTYADKSLMQTKTDQSGKTTSYDYDGRSRVLRSTGSDGKVYNVNYADDDKKNGSIKRVYTDDKGNVTEYHRQFTEGSMSTRVVDPTGKTRDLTHETATGYLLNQVNAAGVRTDYIHDEKGKIIGTKSSEGTTTSIRYDNIGRVLSEQLPDGSLVTYEYLANNAKVATTVTTSGKTSICEFDKSGNITKMVMPDGKTTRFEYDATGQLIHVTETQGK